MIRGMLAPPFVRVSNTTAASPPSCGCPFHQAKALYRFLSNPRVGWEGIPERVRKESTAALRGGMGPVSKPYARVMEGLGQVGKARWLGYKLLAALALGPGEAGPRVRQPGGLSGEGVSELPWGGGEGGGGGAGGGRRQGQAAGLRGRPEGV